MIFYKGQIINPENFRQPSFFISPFRTSDLGKNDSIVKDDSPSDEELLKKFHSFFGKTHEYFLSGKEAINQALRFYNLESDDEVLILTTTSNLYVSSCVTKEIEKFCQWSREKTNKTKLIFVIHEFGKVYPDMERIKSYNIPIIEDCAMSMLSNNSQHQTGQYGDFTIYSVPKFFPIQFGGILRINNNYKTSEAEKPYQNYLQKICLHYLKDIENIIIQRRANNQYLISKLEKIGFKSFFEYNEYETPSVCMFENNGCDLSELKIFLQQNGIECSIFYGKDVFFIPVHQNLGTFEMDCIVNLIEYFVYENK
ncbi:DegT/DnrJ/EryC1/StrS family aminotransferase [Chryseobacterium arthrosphaerae]|uniref:DegT/DnrJ/EryC1/StrS family aminotransferase n=1 Tax=Chryseobacterium arthrosphaerae TaxID=651561 RepID=UPI00241F0F37|nr:DegT/DnrJ/EryC1/StrS family aminotransferase [Chryseobacterium arthrosphaerae]